MSARSLTLRQVAVRRFRNLEEVDLELGPRFNVVAGDNGQGKTNFLDAICTLATSKSFRSAKSEDLIMHGAALASVRGELVEAGSPREQSVGLERGQRVVRIDGKRPRTLFDYASRTPVVVFHPGDTALPAGAGAERRRLLDRVAAHSNKAAWNELESYLRASRARQRALDERGPTARDLDAWEALMIKHGLEVQRMRAETASKIALAAARVFESIAPGGTRLSAAYEPSAPADADEYGATLARNRPMDARRGSARVGPHRDDLGLFLEDKRVRGIASQGQHRLVVLALKAAEIEVLEAVRGVRPILLLDDVSSELDESRTSALFDFIGRQEGQVFLTTTRPGLIDTSASPPGDRQDFVVEAGAVRATGANASSASSMRQRA